MTTRQRKGWFPQKPPEERSNSKHLFHMLRDGTTIETVHLDIADPREREAVIATHFMNSCLPFIEPDDPPVRGVGRDAPWDFSLELASGARRNLEIVAISDSEHQFKLDKREEKIALIGHLPRLPLSQLRKVARDFPNREAEEIMKRAAARAAAKNELVANPWYVEGGTPRVFFQGIAPQPRSTFWELIARAVGSKENKRHAGKGETFLIIDNRTRQFDVCDFQAGNDQIEKRIRSSAFAGVWLYTGYHSNMDGTEAEYSWSLVSGSEKTSDRLAAHLATEGSLPTDEGVVYLTL